MRNPFQLGVQIVRTLSKEGIAPAIRLILLWLICLPFVIKRKQIEHSLTSIEYKTINESKMKLDPADKGISCDLLINGIREPYLTNWIQTHTHNTDVVIDIGANIGYYTLQLAQRAKLVYAIEPVPENFERLYHHIHFNKYHNVIPINAAIGRRSGEEQIYISPSSNLSSMKPASGAKYIKAIPVKVWSLDDVIYHNDYDVVPTMIRMDVEGYETEIIRGAKELLKAKTPLTIVMELHSMLIPYVDYMTMLEILSNNGFKVSAAFKETSPLLYQSSIGKTLYDMVQGTSGIKPGYNKVTYQDLLYKPQYREQMNALQVIFSNI